MNLTEMIANMRTELSDAGSVWTDAQLTRAVKKTVALMSRMIPNRGLLEHTVRIDVDSEAFTTPATASATAIVNAQTLNGVVSGGTLTIADNTPDIPRKLTVTLTDANASVTALTIIVKGYDEDGHYQEESWYLKDLPSGTAVNGIKTFKYVSEVEVDNIAGTAAAADTISVGTGNAYDAWVSLAYKPIRSASCTVTTNPAGTTYTLDTDYEIDYINGRIRYLSGGVMAAATSYLISYDLDSYMLDIHSLLPTEEFLRVERVEYPVGQDPPTIVTFEQVGKFLVLKSKGAKLLDNYHIRLTYLKPWGAPGTLTRGDYPEHLDNAVIIGAVGQALILKAETHVQTAITSIAASKTALDAVAAVTVPDAPDISTYLTEADTALDQIATRLVAGLAFLTSGSAKITTINDADRVAEKYAEYTQAEALLAQGYLNEGIQRMGLAQRTLEKYQLQMSKANQDVAYYQAQLAKAAQYQATCAQYLEAAGRYLASGQAKINEFLIMLGQKPEFNMYKASSEQFA